MIPGSMAGPSCPDRQKTWAEGQTRLLMIEFLAKSSKFGPIKKMKIAVKFFYKAKNNRSFQSIYQ